MKLGERVSWILGTLQRYLFPRLEECGERPLTEKEQQLVLLRSVVQKSFHFPPFAKGGSGGICQYLLRVNQ